MAQTAEQQHTPLPVSGTQPIDEHTTSRQPPPPPKRPPAPSSRKTQPSVNDGAPQAERGHNNPAPPPRPVEIMLAERNARLRELAFEVAPFVADGLKPNVVKFLFTDRTAEGFVPLLVKSFHDDPVWITGFISAEINKRSADLKAQHVEVQTFRDVTTARIQHALINTLKNFEQSAEKKFEGLSERREKEYRKLLPELAKGLTDIAVAGAVKTSALDLLKKVDGIKAEVTEAEKDVKRLREEQKTLELTIKQQTTVVTKLDESIKTATATLKATQALLEKATGAFTDAAASASKTSEKAIAATAEAAEKQAKIAAKPIPYRQGSSGFGSALRFVVIMAAIAAAAYYFLSGGKLGLNTESSHPATRSEAPAASAAQLAPVNLTAPVALAKPASKPATAKVPVTNALSFPDKQEDASDSSEASTPSQTPQCIHAVTDSVVHDGGNQWSRTTNGVKWSCSTFSQDSIRPGVSQLCGCTKQVLGN